MVTIETIATLSLNALSSIATLALVAIGLMIIFGFMGVINTAHGAFYAIGAYTVWYAGNVLGLGFWVGLMLAPFIGGAIGLLVETIVVKHLYNRLVDSLLATWGVALVFQQLLIMGFGNTTRSINSPLQGRVDLGIITYPTYRLFVIGFVTVLLITVFAAFYRTNLGIRLRAVIEDGETAELMGINQDRIYKLSFSFGTALAALAGAVVAPFQSITALMGLDILIQSFLTVILGGTGTLYGVIPGSVVVGGLGNILTYNFQPLLAEAIVYILVVTIVLIHPRGIIGEKYA